MYLEISEEELKQLRACVGIALLKGKEEAEKGQAVSDNALHLLKVLDKAPSTLSLTPPAFLLHNK